LTSFRVRTDIIHLFSLYCELMSPHRFLATSAPCGRFTSGTRIRQRARTVAGGPRAAAAASHTAAREPLGTSTARPLWLLLAATVWLCGCGSATFKASTLPPEYAASRTEGTRKIDLSNLAINSVRSEAIYPGDVLEVTIATGLEEKSPECWPLRVSEAGDAEVPLVGSVHVAGLLLPDAEQMLRHECVTRRLYRDPLVSILLRNRKTIRVTVVGAVQNPGTYELPAVSSDLLAALIAAGGLSEKASTIVEIRSLGDANVFVSTGGEPRRTVAQAGSVRVDLIAAGQGLSPDYRIDDGSVVMVREEEPKTIQVIGLVRKPDQLEITPGKEVRLLDAIARAGGLTLELADKVHVIRNLEKSDKPVVIEASIGEAKRGGPANLLLAPGDVVSVEETPLTFTISTIQNFVRVGFSAAIPGF
jgi:polysaccharide biosynthesis/export protein